jgi:hypothetical protein
VEMHYTILARHVPGRDGETFRVPYTKTNPVEMKHIFVIFCSIAVLRASELT